MAELSLSWRQWRGLGPRTSRGTPRLSHPDPRAGTRTLGYGWGLRLRAALRSRSMAGALRQIRHSDWLSSSPRTVCVL
jgi:hypothetical protein